MFMYSNTARVIQLPLFVHSNSAKYGATVVKTNGKAKRVNLLMSEIEVCIACVAVIIRRYNPK